MTKDCYAKLEALHDHGLHLVKYVVEKDFKHALENGYEKDDLVGYGVFGLLKAAAQYDPSKGVSFVTFACKNIKREIINFIRQKCQRRQKHLEELDRETYQLFTYRESEDDYDDDDERTYVRRMVNKLPQPQRQFVKSYYLKDMSVREYQQSTLMKRHRIFQLRRQSLALLRVMMGFQKACLIP